jgi:hypothetical protein
VIVAEPHTLVVIAGLNPAIPQPRAWRNRNGMDARIKSGHDDIWKSA